MGAVRPEHDLTLRLELAKDGAHLGRGHGPREVLHDVLGTMVPVENLVEHLAGAVRTAFFCSSEASAAGSSASGADAGASAAPYFCRAKPW